MRDVIRIADGRDGIVDRSVAVREISTPMKELIAAVLRGKVVGWPWVWSGIERTWFLDVAARHRVQALLVHWLDRTAVLRRWPEEVGEPLVAAAREQAWSDAVQGRELERVLATLSAAGVQPLLMKGAALAYLHYPQPFLRPRGDTDLLVQKTDVATVTQVMQGLGYRREPLVSGDLIMHQCPFTRVHGAGVLHVYDVHWRIANPYAFAEVFTFDELQRRSIPVPALGQHARALGDVDALLLACLHRVAHHYDSADLLWLYDIHLLASRVGDSALGQFASLAALKGLRAVSASGLMRAQRTFETRVPGEVTEILSLGDEKESSAAYLDGRARQVDLLFLNLRALPGWRARGRLLREHLFPPPAYMRERYAVSSPLLLPVLYAHRFVCGARKWFRRPERDR